MESHSAHPRLLDVVALTSDLPSHDLRRGQVGTVVEVLGQDHFEVEFADDEGRAYASVAVPASRLMALRYRPTKAA
jgi:catabolite regulation protein CreA